MTLNLNEEIAMGSRTVPAGKKVPRREKAFPSVPAAPPWEPGGGVDLGWFRWEAENAPPRPAWYHVILQDGEDLSALYQKDGQWWTLERGAVTPIFWRDALYQSQAPLIGSRAAGP